jgi:hypothetical protein
MGLSRTIRSGLKELIKGTRLYDGLTGAVNRSSSLEQLLQKRWAHELSRLRISEAPLPSFEEVGFGCYSQHDEDGILLFLFARIGAETKTVVEICAGDGYQCNATNLLINHGWNGLLFDGHWPNVKAGRRHFARHPRTRAWPPKFEHAWITRENVNGLIERQEISGEIDLLSLDIDGNDYWIWESLTCVNPRVVVLEINQLWGEEKAVSVPYAPDFKALFSEHGSDYGGASLPAFVQLGRKKGYRLIGAEKYGTNVFFMRDDVGTDTFPALPATACLEHPRALFSRRHRLPLVRNRDWREV